MGGPSREDSERVDRGPYRSALVTHPRGPRRRGLAVTAVATTALAALAAFAVTTSRRVAPPRAASPIATPGATAPPSGPVTGATLLAGGERICVHARDGAGRHEVVCRPEGTVNLRGEVRDAARSWRSEELVHLAVATGASETPGEDAILATGVQRDGRVVAFRRLSDRAEVVEMPATGAHGAVVEAHYVAGYYTVGSGCESESQWWSEWVVRTADGAFLMPWGSDWLTVLGAGEYVPGTARDLGTLYVRASDGRAVQQPLPWPESRQDLAIPPSPPTRLRAEPIAGLDVPYIVELASFGGQRCTRNGEGLFRCAPGPWQQAGAGRAVPGPPDGAVAMAAGPHDLCANARNGAWWCAHGPDETPPEGPGEGELALRPEPGLRGARELAFTEDTGCARWDSGEVRCWGRAARGGWLRSRAAATEIAGLPSATALAVGDRFACAIAGGAAWCWGDLDQPLPGAPRGHAARPVRLPGASPVRALAAHAGQIALAVGGEVWRPHYAEGLQAVGLRAAGAAGEVGSIALVDDGGCATMTTGQVWCWAWSSGTDPHDVARVRALEQHPVVAPAWRDICAVRHGAPFVCGGPPYYTPFDQAVWPGGATPWHDALALSRDCSLGHDRVVRCGAEGVKFPLGAVAGELDAVVAVDDGPRDPRSSAVAPCVLGSNGRVACATWETRSFERVAGVEDAAQIGGGPRFGCARRRDGHVLCWGDNAAGSLAARDADRTPWLVPFTR